MYEEDQNRSFREEPEKGEPGRRGTLAGKIAAIIGGGLLFGVVAGVTMLGVYTLGEQFLSRFLPEEQLTVAESEKQIEDPGTVEWPRADMPPVGSDPYPGDQTISGMMDVSGIVERAMPSVVAITSKTLYESQDPYAWFFGGGGSRVYEVPSSGSGIIIDKNDTDLFIVTNNHVVESSTELTVSFIDNQAVEATVRGTDAQADLAVITVALDSISPETMGKISVAELGDSDRLKVGQGVVAIGNALGYGQSVTVGYISALNRQVRIDQNTVRTLLQTDAAINPGNSGGALLNLQGEVIGINAAKYTSTSVEGVGYAIPISQAQDIMGSLINRRTGEPLEEGRQGHLGIQGTSVTKDTAKSLGMPEGIYVYKILEGGAASQTDLKEKEIITKVEGQTVRSMSELQEILAYYEVGEDVVLTVQSLADGSYVERKITVTLAPLP